jgi:hypothetical protein
VFARASGGGGFGPKFEREPLGLGLGSAVGNGSGAQWGNVVGCGVCGGCGGLGGRSMARGRTAGFGAKSRKLSDYGLVLGWVWDAGKNVGSVVSQDRPPAES